MKTLIIFTLVYLATVTNGYTAGLGGTVYVPNLHAKCLSNHQTRLLECASTEGPVTETDLDCAENSLAEYRKCEQLLNKLRALDTAVPIVPRTYDPSALLEKLKKEDNYVD